MTIQTTANKVVIAGTGALTVFPFSFIAGAGSNLVVTYTDASGNQTVLNASQYAVALNAAPANNIWGVGGSVTYAPTPAIAVGTTLTIQRIVPLQQLVTINNQGAFDPQVIEQALDQLEFQIQQVANLQGSFLQANPADATGLAPLPPIAQRASKSAIFDSAGNLTAGNVISNTTVSAAMIAVVTAATLALARTALGLGTAAVENLAGAGYSIIDDGSGNLTTPNIAAATILGNNTGGAAKAIALTVAQVNAMIGASGTGTVTNAALTMPPEFAVAGSPITTSGTFAVTKATQAANLGYFGPTTGAAAAPSFRGMVTNDLPTVTGIAGTYGAGTGSDFIDRLIVDAKGRITTIHFSTFSSPPPSGGGGGGTCFPGWSLETMADGSEKPISEVRIGEKVRGRKGEINKVIALERPLLGSRLMWLINGKLHTTDEHLILHPDGTFGAISLNAIKAEWGVPLPMIVAGGRTVMQVTVGLPDEMVSQLRVGELIEMGDGAAVDIKTLRHLASDEWPPETQLYNLIVDGSGVHTNSGFVVGGGTNHERWDYAKWTAKEQS